jgi:hypothetical protein
MSASTTRQVRHKIPLPLSIVARPHEAGPILSWRADCWGKSGRYLLMLSVSQFDPFQTFDVDADNRFCTVGPFVGPSRLAGLRNTALRFCAE